MIFLPVTAKLVTLGELKTTYTLRDYFDLMDASKDLIETIQKEISKSIPN